MAGTIVDLVSPSLAGDGVATFEGLLTPGFVNSHCHLELSHLKQTIAEATGLVAFVQQVMGSRAAVMEIKMQAMINAEIEMYQAGIVAVGDVCNTADSIIVKGQSQLHWHNFIEVSGFTDATAQARLDNMKTVFEAFKTAGNPAQNTFSPHAPYSVSKKLFQLLNHETASQTITIHNQEAAVENELYQSKTGGFLGLYQNFGIDIAAFEPTGKSSFESWLPYFSNQQSILCVHNSFTSPADVAFYHQQLLAQKRPLYFCICVNANKYIEQKVPPINLLRNAGCNIVLGTDSYASNHQLNILEEIKTIQKETNYTIKLEEVLGWATFSGATALGLNNLLGSFEKGKKPGIVLIEGLTAGENGSLQTNHNSVASRIF